MANEVFTEVDPGSLDDLEESAGLESLEKKYQAQMRQIVTQKLDLPVSALQTMLKEQIELSPDFQRRDRWNEMRQSRWIESLVMNVPIPPVFLGEDEYGKYVVLDGRQRLTAISKFLNNELKLSGLTVWDDLNGMTFQEMVKRKLDKYLTRRFVPAVVILKESSLIVKYDVFDRLNTGGVEANPMEIRNAICRGSFSNNLVKLSRMPDFCTLWGIPTDDIEAEGNQLFRSMTDMEIALRFFALSEVGSMTTGFKGYLSEFMAERNKAYEKNPLLSSQDELLFTQAVKCCTKVFGDTAFCKKPVSGKQRSIPFSDALMISLAEFDPDTITPSIAAAIEKNVTDLFTSATFLKAIGSGTNGRGAIESRILEAKTAVRKAFE